MEQYQFWIGFGFAAVVVLVLTYVVIIGIRPDQFVPLKLLCSFCGAFSGILISGSLLVNLEGTLGNGKYAINGAAGFALFLIVWFFFPKEPEAPAPKPPPDGINISIPAGATFRGTVEILVKIDNSVPEFENFEAEELNAALKAWDLKEKTVGDALRRLRSISLEPNAIGKYEVSYSDSTYRLIAVAKATVPEAKTSSGGKTMGGRIKRK